jgi:hypothetical protein
MRSPPRIVGTNDAQAVIGKMKQAPKASQGKWDLLDQVGVLTGPEGFRPLDQGGCSLADPSKKD